MDLPSFSLSDDDDDIEVCDLGERKTANSLYGKILLMKRVNRERFISTMNFIWRTEDPVMVEMVSCNIFVFHFGTEEDKRWVLAGGPWKYLENVVVLEAPVVIGDYTSMKFNLVSFWIQIHNQLLMCMTKETGLSLGKQIGMVEEVDHGATADCLGKYIRIRVQVDITKPLKRGLKVKADAAGTLIIAILKMKGCRISATDMEFWDILF